MKAIVILLDSLCRRFLSVYGAQDPAFTPNMERLAAHGVVFEQHWCGSAPCMPARRDIMTGRLNFMERPWGGMEPFDHSLAKLLSTNNVYTHMETDHYHYAGKGGENYWSDFTSYRLHRGAENDTLYWGPGKNGVRGKSEEGNPGKSVGAYRDTMAHYDGVDDNYSTPRSLSAAAQWLEQFHDADNFFLWAEGFDPHEPFDVPEEYLALYGQTKRPELAYWPAYTTADHYSQEQLSYFTLLYKALLSMTDRYVGKILDVLDRYDLWKDTMVILTTDHGYMLGEHGFMAKNYMPDYNEIFHLPFIVARPGTAPGRSAALTQNVDLLPTLLEYFGVPLSRCRNPLHGKSLLPLLCGKASSLRDGVLFGVYAKSVNLFDGRYVYMRRPVSSDNEPLYLYASQMALMGCTLGYDIMSDEDISHMECGRFLPWTKYPVYRIPARNVRWPNTSLRFDHINDRLPENLLFDLWTDYAQEHPLQDKALEEELCRKLTALMAAHDCPLEQYQRLGLAGQNA